MSCIYYGNQEGLTYNKREHVFPASLGCKTMLPKGWVSDQANELFSPMEEILTRRSLISTERALFGPGKRGSLAPQKAAQSDVCVGVDEKGDRVLSYMALGTPYNISHFCRGAKQYRICLAVKDMPDAASKFISILNQFGEQTKYVTLTSKDISPDEVLVGYHKGKYYIAFHPSKKDCYHIEKEIKVFLSYSDAVLNAKKMREEQTHVKMGFQLQETPETSRMCAKILLNATAYLYGKEFAERPEFDEVRAWILHGNHSEKFCRLPSAVEEAEVLHKIVPEKSHWCQFGMIQNQFVGVLCLYGFWQWVVPLAYFDEPPIHEPNAFICDWENQKDYKLLDYILEYQGLSAKV